MPDHRGSGVAQLVTAGSFVVMDEEKVVLSNTECKESMLINLGGGDIMYTSTWPVQQYFNHQNNIKHIYILMKDCSNLFFSVCTPTTENYFCLC